MTHIRKLSDTLDDFSSKLGKSLGGVSANLPTAWVPGFEAAHNSALQALILARFRTNDLLTVLRPNREVTREHVPQLTQMELRLTDAATALRTLETWVSTRLRALSHPSAQVPAATRVTLERLLRGVRDLAQKLEEAHRAVARTRTRVM